MTELQIMLQQYREGERGMPTYDELAALVNAPTLDQTIDGMYAKVAAFYQVPERLLRGTPVFQSAEQNEQLARDAQAILDVAKQILSTVSPVQAQEPVDGRNITAWDIFGYSLCCGNNQKAVGDALKEMWAILDKNHDLHISVSDATAAPVQPVAVPDGKQIGYAVYGISGGKHYLHDIKMMSEAEDGEWKGDNCFLDDYWAGNEPVFLAAPAAQGDAIRKVEVDDQGPLGIVTKTTYALAKSKDTEAAAFYRYLRDEVIGDDPEAIGMDKAKNPGLDAACRAAIAAKAAS